MKGADKNWPAWFNGPKGETAIFEAADDVPNGWTSGAEKRTAKGAAKSPAAPPAKDPAKTPAPAGDGLDAHGHAYDSKLHAGTGSKTKAGLWRMKVGVKRPDPAPGFPKPPLDL